MNEPGATNEVTESQAILLGKDGQPLATVQATLLPKQRFGDFQLLSLAEADRILANATSLQTSGHGRLRLVSLRRCNELHIAAPPGHSHLEFYYEPMS